jgi:hypothetical protein
MAGMPRLIDWGARFGFIREAVVRLAAGGGASAVTIPAVAAQLGVSSATLRRALAEPDILPWMGADWIARERHYRRFLRGVPRGTERGSVGHGVWLLRSELPEDPEDRERELAWPQLVHPGAGESILKLQASEDEYVESLIHEVLQLLGTEETTRPAQQTMVRAVLDGLKLALVRERVSPEEAFACLDQVLAQLPLSPSAPGSPR